MSGAAKKPVKLVITGWSGCGFFEKAAKRAQEVAQKYPGDFTAEINDMVKPEFQKWVAEQTVKYNNTHKSSPLVTKNDMFLGGCDDVLEFLRLYEESQAKSVKFVDDDEPEEHSYDFDLIVIGGGSGGMAVSKAAASYLTPGGGDSGLPPKVCCLDFVKPSPIGTKWGFGGTCVNVGCIPKKLYHTAAITRDTVKLSPAYGTPEETAKLGATVWETVRENIQMHIKSINFGSVAEMRTGNVKYKNALGRLVDSHTVECTNKKGAKETITARRIIVATGGRPSYPEIPGAKEYGITSDDIFSLEQAPGKTVVVGASYIALECAGFLTGLGYETIVMMRSIPLRGFDQQIAELIVKQMEHEGTKVVRGVTPTSVEQLASGKKVVTYSNGHKEECDTVLFAMGRTADTNIGLQEIGITLSRSGKVAVDACERTSVPNVYAIGDIVEGGLELTPVAIQSGRYLAGRLYGKKSNLMDYSNMVPTTVFTPIEYGVCGYSEEDAIKKFGEENLEIYHAYFTPLEWTVPHRDASNCYVKMITLKSEAERVVGFHITSPNAGEILQGVGVAMQCGATKKHFDDTVGIHPTVAEQMTTLTVTKSSGASAEQGGC
ncbi:Thioredoxin reductase SEP1 [Diplonema papillatum]|nr:Thioredoxin reductase SEP1 [Diplonema papillatum]